MAEDSFGFTKNTEAIARRPSFSDTLNNVLSASGTKKGNGYLQKKSSTGRYNKRWFVVHGHYLSYFRTDPTSEKKKEPLGTLDLWHVEGVALDDSTITLRLSPHAMAARMEEMGGDTAKKIISANPFAKNMARRVDHLRRGTGATPSFTLKAASASEAQVWLAMMRESPLMGSLALLQKSLASDNELVVKELRFKMPPKREFTFADVTNMFDGVTDILLRGVPASGTVLTVVLTSGAEKKAVVEGSGPFEPALGESAGSMTISLPQGVQVKVEWSRRYSPMAEKGGIIAVAFVAVFLLALVGTRNLIASVVLGALSAGGAAGLIIQREKTTNDVVIRSASVIKTVTPSSPPPSPPSSPKSSRGKKKEKAPVKLGISTDPNVTPEEAGMIETLRERTKDMWNVQPFVDDFIKKNEKFMKEWHSDMGALKNPAKIKTVMDKHILEDFRIVRFLRARKHNLDKAEHMMRDALLWRIVLGSDEIATDPEVSKPPEWLLNYFGSPRNLRVIQSQEDRLSRFYGRDREGHAAIFIRAGRLTSRKIFKKMCSKPCFMAKYLVRTVEIMRLDLEKLREKSGGKVETVVSLVIDLDNFAISEQLPIGDMVAFARRFFPVFATGFPELLHRVLVFNAPWLFGTLWSAIKPFIPEEVQEKIQIHSGEIKYDKHIKPYFEEQYIPKYFGGTMVDEEDGNEFCLQRVVPYGPYSLPNEGYALLEGTDPQAQSW